MEIVSCSLSAGSMVLSLMFPVFNPFSVVFCSWLESIVQFIFTLNKPHYYIPFSGHKAKLIFIVTWPNISHEKSREWVMISHLTLGAEIRVSNQAFWYSRKPHLEVPGLVFCKHLSESQQCEQNPAALGAWLSHSPYPWVSWSTRAPPVRSPGCGPGPAFSTGIDHVVRTCPVPASMNGQNQGVNVLLLIKSSLISDRGWSISVFLYLNHGSLS